MLQMQVGLQTSVSLRCVWQARENTTASLSGRATLAGAMQLEVGCSGRLSDRSSTGCNVLVSHQVRGMQTDC